MKASIILAAFVALAGAASASAQGLAEAGAAVDLADKTYDLVEKATKGVYAAVKSQEPVFTREIVPFDIKLPKGCDEGTSFDSDAYPDVVFAFGPEQNVAFQLEWSATECPAPAGYKKGPQRWFYLRSARLDPIKTSVKFGHDMTLRVTAGEIRSQRYIPKSAAGKMMPPSAVFMAGSIELEVESKNISEYHSDRVEILFDAMGTCTIKGNVDVFKLTNGECDVDSRHRGVTTMAKTPAKTTAK